MSCRRFLDSIVVLAIAISLAGSADQAQAQARTSIAPQRPTSAIPIVVGNDADAAGLA